MTARNTARFIKVIIWVGNFRYRPAQPNANANVDEPRRRDGRRHQLHPVFLVEHVLHGEEHVEVPANARVAPTNRRHRSRQPWILAGLGLTF